MFGLFYITDPKIREFYFGKEEKETKKEQKENTQEKGETRR